MCSTCGLLSSEEIAELIPCIVSGSTDGTGPENPHPSFRHYEHLETIGPTAPVNHPSAMSCLCLGQG